MLSITSCFLGRHSKPMLLETIMKLNVTFNEHTLTIHERECRKTDNYITSPYNALASSLQEHYCEHPS